MSWKVLRCKDWLNCQLITTHERFYLPKMGTWSITSLCREYWRSGNCGWIPEPQQHERTSHAMKTLNYWISVCHTTPFQQFTYVQICPRKFVMLANKPVRMPPNEIIIRKPVNHMHQNLRYHIHGVLPWSAQSTHYEDLPSANTVTTTRINSSDGVNVGGDCQSWCKEHWNGFLVKLLFQWYIVSP